MTDGWVASELELMARHGFAVFEGRVIHDAQPPIPDATRAEIESKLRGPIPTDLLELWRVCFGGWLDYELDVEFGGDVYGVSFEELFFPESGGYHDLWGWIDNELRVVEESAQGDWDGLLSHLPFGGFEHGDRLYVKVAPGPDYGSVVAYSAPVHGWTGRLQEPGVATVAPDLRSFFRDHLYLEKLPEDAEFEPESSDQLSTLAGLGSAERDLAKRLDDVFRTAYRSWREAADEDRLLSDPHLLRLALSDIVELDDVDTLNDLISAGLDPELRFRGGGSVIDWAANAGANAIYDHLVSKGVDRSRVVAWGSRLLSVDRLRGAIEAGAAIDMNHIVICANAGKVDALRLLSSAYLQKSPHERETLIRKLQEATSRGGPQDPEVGQAIRALHDYVGAGDADVNWSNRLL